MAKLAPLLFILAAAIVAAVFLFDNEDPAGPSLEPGEEFEDERAAPGLRTSDAARPRTPVVKEAGPTTAPPEGPPRGGSVRFIHGVVLDDATGKPIAGATLAAEPAGPCPRLPAAFHDALQSGPVARSVRYLTAPAPTKADGRFDWRVGDVRHLRPDFDVFTSAPGYITAAHCEPEVGAELTIRLKKAIPLEITVTDRHGRPIEGAHLIVEPGPKTEHVPGHAGRGVTDENGRGSVDGLRPGAIVLRVDHPAWMPAVTEPFDPAVEASKAVELSPALLARFRIRSDDGQGIENPTLAWRTSGEPPADGLLLLPVRNSGTDDVPNAEVLSTPIRIPCDHPTVQFEIKAEGFAEWRQAEPVPAAGGETEVIVVLTRDLAQGSLEIAFQGPDGKPVAYARLGAGSPTIMPLDDVDPGAITMEASTTLRFNALPPGRYRIGKRSPDFAPLELDAEVRAGEANRVTAKLRPAAKVRVRFLSSTPGTMVQFRLLRGREELPAYPVRDGKPGAAGSSDAPLSVQGSEGRLFTGLPGGSCTIEVMNKELVAVRQTLQLQEGETTEVEIEVQRR